MINQINSWSEVLKNIEILKKDFDIIEKSDNIALFGAGRAALNALKYLKKNDYKITCFIDNSKEKQGQNIDGIPIVSMNDPLVESVKTILITLKKHSNQIKKLFPSHTCLSFDEWFIIKNIKEYESIRNNLLQDTKSQKTLDNLLMGVLTGQNNYYAEIMEPDQYFNLCHFIGDGDEFFVDAGAYVGDTIEKFIWLNGGNFKQISAFEPGDKQFKALEKRTERLKAEWALDENAISLIKGGVAEENGYALFDISSDNRLQSTNLKISTEETNTSSIPLYSLDSILENQPVSFIKADIEGMEIAMLKGAEHLIKINKPKLAICTYHNIDDIFEVIKLVKNFVPEYKMALRHHSPTQSETVIYCWVEEN